MLLSNFETLLLFYHKHHFKLHEFRKTYDIKVFEPLQASIFSFCLDWKLLKLKHPFFCVLWMMLYSFVVFLQLPDMIVMKSTNFLARMTKVLVVWVMKYNMLSFYKNRSVRSKELCRKDFVYMILDLVYQRHSPLPILFHWQAI